MRIYSFVLGLNLYFSFDRIRGGTIESCDQIFDRYRPQEG